MVFSTYFRAFHKLVPYAEPVSNDFIVVVLELPKLKSSTVLVFAASTTEQSLIKLLLVCFRNYFLYFPTLIGSVLIATST